MQDCQSLSAELSVFHSKEFTVLSTPVPRKETEPKAKAGWICCFKSLGKAQDVNIGGRLPTMHSHRDHWVGDQTSAVWLCFCLDSRLSKAVCMACACEMYFYCMPPVPKERQETSNPIWHKHSLWVAVLLTLHLLVGKITPSYTFASAAGLICTALCSWLLILMFNLEVQCRAHGTEGQEEIKLNDARINIVMVRGGTINGTSCPLEKSKLTQCNFGTISWLCIIIRMGNAHWAVDVYIVGLFV